MNADVDVRDPDEKSIMTYVAQFLQYSRDLPVPEEEMQVCIAVSYSTQTSSNTVHHFTLQQHLQKSFHVSVAPSSDRILLKMVSAVYPPQSNVNN